MHLFEYIYYLFLFFPFHQLLELLTGLFHLSSIHSACKDIINARDHDQGQNSSVKQTSDGNHSHRLAQSCSHIVGKYHGGKSQNRGESCHQHRTQSGPPCCQNRLPALHPTLPELIHIVNEYNSVIYNNTGEHDKADHGNDTDLTPGEVEPQESSGERQRNCKDDDEGRSERLELGYHDQIDQRESDQHHQKHLTHGMHDLFVLSAVFDDDSVFHQILIFDGLSELAGHLGDIISVFHSGADGGAAALAVVLDLIERCVFTDVCDPDQFDGLLGPVFFVDLQFQILQLISGETGRSVLDADIDAGPSFFEGRRFFFFCQLLGDLLP